MGRRRKGNSAMPMCRHCGRKQGHLPQCTRRIRSVVRGRPKRPTLEEAHEWFRLFGYNRNCISANGAKYFALLLELVESRCGPPS
jgi:hypothetical protein